MKRIGLLEIRCSLHALSGLCEISNTQKCQVTVFTTKPLFSQVNEELVGNTAGFEWILKEEDESIRKYLKRIERICNSRIDLLVVNSIRNWQFLYFNPECKKIFWMYNVKTWFMPINAVGIFIIRMFTKLKFLTELRSIIVNLMSAITRIYTLPKYDGLIVEYSSIKRYILENFHYKKEIYVFPNWPAKNTPYHSINKKIRFIIPGTVSERRRNYEPVLRTFEDLFLKYNEIIELCLLGDPEGEYGEKIISICKEFKKNGYFISWFEEKVSSDIFERIYINSDVVIDPINLVYEFGYEREIYSVTKGTGVSSDCIRYNKLFIVPFGFEIPKELKSSILTYKSEKDLKNILEAFVGDVKKLENFKKEAFNNSKKFSLERLQGSFNKMVEELLSN